MAKQTNRETRERPGGDGDKTAAGGTEHRITVESSGETFACAEAENVLAAMERGRCHGIPVGCRNGGCGACMVRITAGRYQTRKMSRAVVSEQEEAENCVLACKVYPLSDLTLQVLGRVWEPTTVRTKASFNFGVAIEAPATVKPERRR